jgi:hypothetical protein
MGAQHEIAGQKAESLGVPMHAGTANPVAKHECAPIAHRQRCLIGIVSERHRRLRRTEKKLVLQPVTPLVLSVGNKKITRCVAPRAALDGDNVESFVGKFLRKNGARPSQPNDGDVLAWEFASHCASRCNLLNEAAGATKAQKFTETNSDEC